MDLLTAKIAPAFRDAGWFHGRSVDVDRNVPRAHPAFVILRAFAGLNVGKTGPGKECATSNIEFGLPPCRDENVDAWQLALNTEFVCLGEYHCGHGQLWLDNKSRLFASGLVAPMMLFVGKSFAEGVEALLNGHRPRPMLLPWQQKVMVWGEWFDAGDQCVLKPDSFYGS